MARDFGTYRKLFDHPDPDFERLPFRVRSLAAELVRRCDRIGRIVPVRDACDVTDVTLSQFAKLIDDLAFHVRANCPEDVRFLRDCIPVLIEDGYLVLLGGYLTIRNFAEAQRSESADRMARKRGRDSGAGRVTVTSPPSQPSPGLISSTMVSDPDLRGSPEGGSTERLNASGSVGSVGRSELLRTPESPERARTETPRSAPNVGGARGQSAPDRRAPSTASEAMALPVQERAEWVRGDPMLATYLEPHKWPEVMAVASAVAQAAGIRRPKLGATRDRGVEAIVALYADGWTQAELERAVAVAVRSEWWAKGSRGLASLTPEVIRRALGDEPELTPEEQAQADAIVKRYGGAKAS